MTGSDPLGPGELDGLQREALRSREEIEREQSAPSDDDYEPLTLNEAHWWVRPKWVKYVSWGFGLPVGLFWAYEVRYGDIFTLDPRLIDICFETLFVIAALQLIFIFRAYWRMDI